MFEEEKKGDNESANQGPNEGADGSSVVVAKQKITLSKDASKKKKRIEVIQNHHHSNHHSSQAATNVGEEDENGYVSILIFHDPKTRSHFLLSL